MTGRRRLIRLVTAAGAAVGLSISAPVTAQDEAPPAVLLILDGSGSMNAADDSGRPLIDLAKEALTSIVRVLPAGGVDVGLRVYGHRTPDTDQAVGCADSELVVPVEPLEPDRMTQAIDAVSPSGFTPIGLSLTEAGDDLAGRDNATVILVSDGEDTCAPPDPCEVAADLAARGITVNTVGFYLDDGSAARGQLECIAAATGGSYRDADDEADLAGVVGVLLSEVPGVGNFHIPFDGATDPTNAPLVPITLGDESDPHRFAALRTTISAGETRWFAVDVPDGHFVELIGDARAFVEAAIPEPGDAVVLRILDDEGRDVGVAGRFGLDRIDLGTIVAVDLGYLQTMNIETAHLVAPWSEFATEPSVTEGLEYLGYDQESWDAEQRSAQRYERLGPIPAGTYLIGVTWESDLDATTTFDHLIGLQLQGATPSGPMTLAGSTDPASPTQPPDVPSYDAWPFHDPVLDPMRELYGEGPIAPNETRWFSLEVEWDEQVLVDALLASPLGTPLPADDELAIEILDPIGEIATTPHPSGREVSGAVGEVPTYFGQGFEPRPLVSASARPPGSEPPPPGEYRVGVTWSSASPDAAPETMLEVRIGTAQPDGMVPVPPAPATTIPESEVRADDTGDDEAPSAAAVPSTDDDTGSTQESSGTDRPETDSDDDGAAFPLVPVAGALVIVGVAAAVWAIRRRR